MGDNKINEDNPSYLIISREETNPETVNLEQGNSLFLGSGSNCKVVLQGEQIQGIHCMIWLDEQGVLNIQDWNTGTTMLNGSAVGTECTLNSGDRVAIGDYLIIPVLDRAFHLGIATELLKKPIPQSKTESKAVVAESVIEMPAPVDELSTAFNPSLLVENDFNDDFTTQEIEHLVSESNRRQKNDEVEVADANSSPSLNQETEKSKFTYDINADLEEEDSTLGAAGFDSSTANPFASSPFTSDSFDSDSLSSRFNMPSDDDLGENEEVDLLRVEVEQLRFEIVERDVQIQSLKDAGPSKSETADDDQTLKLVNRLEELLTELQSSDDRVQGLEDLLRLSDEATRAEQDERQQLESWVTEIENRVEQRDSEAEAEISRATKRLQEAQTHAKHVDAQFQKLVQSQKNIAAGAEPNEQSQELVNECRIQIEELRQQVQSLTDENEQLKSRPVSDEDEIKASEQLKVLQDKLAKIEVEASYERAETARRQAELERIRGELAEKLKSAKGIGENDSRIKAMRDHLREIHEEEKIEREERRQRSLGGRIASLLTRTR